MNYKGGKILKSVNIVKKLQKEGYNIIYKKWGYCPNIPHVQLEGFDFSIAEKTYQGNWQSCKTDFIYTHVLEALDLAKTYNPIFLRKIEQVPLEQWYYSQYLILNMEDYYKYKKGIHPFDNYYKELERLK